MPRAGTIHKVGLAGRFSPRAVGGSVLGGMLQNSTVPCCKLFEVVYWGVRSTFHRLCIVVVDIVQHETHAKHAHLVHNTETTDGTSNAKSTTPKH